MFGLGGYNAEIADVENRGGDVRSVFVVSTGVTKNAAKRAARFKARTIIPFREQEVEFIEEDTHRSPVPNRYSFRVTSK